MPKKLFAIAVEKGVRGTPDILYTHAETREDVLVALVALTNPLPKRSRVVGVSEVVGYLADEQGRILV